VQGEEEKDEEEKATLIKSRDIQRASPGKWGIIINNCDVLIPHRLSSTWCPMSAKKGKSRREMNRMS